MTLRLALPLLLAHAAAAADWPNFLGPTQNNHCAEELHLDWSEKAPPEVYRIKTGASYSAPVVADGKLISFHRVDDEERVDCHDAVSGERMWRFSYPSNYVDQYGYNNGPRGSPLIHGGRVYTWGAEGMMSCLELETGEKIWQRPLNAEYEVPQNFFGVGSAPVIDKGILLANVGGPDGHGVMGLDAATGKTRWAVSDHGASYSTPVVHDIDGTRTAVFFTRRGLLTVDPSTGRKRHDYFFRSRKRESVNAANPVVVDDLIFLSATYNTGAVTLRVEGDTLHEVWKDEEAMETHWNTCVHHEGFLYGSSGRHGPEAVFRCIELKTGKVRWSSPRGFGRSFLLRVGDTFIAFGERGQLATIAVDPDRFVMGKAWTFTGYPSWAPPVPANGYLYIRDDRQIVCLDLRKQSGD